MLGGLFGVASKNNCARDLFFGTDYNTHLGTEVGGLALLNGDIEIISHDISNSQFKSKFGKHYGSLKGRLGIGVISDTKEEQPIVFETKIGKFALCTIGLIKNAKELYSELISNGATFKRSRQKKGITILNQTEIVGELICTGSNIVDGIEKMYNKIDGSISLLLLSENDNAIYAAGDTFPLVVGSKEKSWAVASETTGFPNLGYQAVKFLDYREIVSFGENGLKTRAAAQGKKRFCPFLHVYSGFPASDFYGINSEIVRERCGGFLAENDEVEADLVLGVADSGLPHSVGYVKRKIELAKEKVQKLLSEFRGGKINSTELEASINHVMALVAPLRRPLIKYTPGWGRSYIPPVQRKRELIAKYKQVPNPQIIKGMSIILVDDSIRRGTQLQDLLREKIWPFEPKEIHGRIASPPQLHPCIFDLSTKNSDLATYKSLESVGQEGDFAQCMDSTTADYKKMVEEIRRRIGFTTLRFITLDEMVKAVIEAPNNKNLKKEDLCMYCWTGNF
ncbi:MAG: amidophosphoribosyltransferase [Candidatus Bathyarchaeota archaeon]|nr:amidophosphoribosyltransferase [Candidatus Bathyarchaeota archaeon]